MGRKWDYRSLAKEGVRGDAACTSAKPSNKNKGGKKKRNKNPSQKKKEEKKSRTKTWPAQEDGLMQSGLGLEIRLNDGREVVI